MATTFVRLVMISSQVGKCARLRLWLLSFWLRLVLLCLRLLLRLLRPSLYTPHAPALGLAPAPGPAPAAHCFHLLWTTMFNLAVRHGSPRELLGVLAGK